MAEKKMDMWLFIAAAFIAGLLIGGGANKGTCTATGAEPKRREAPRSGNRARWSSEYCGG